VTGLRERIAVWIAGLAPRERLLLGAAGGVFVVVLLWLGLVLPVLGAIRSAGMRVEAAEADLQRAQQLQAELAALQGRLGSVEQRIHQGPRGNLFTTLEQLAAKSAVKVESMEPQAAAGGDAYKETKIQVVLKQVTLAQVVNFLDKIESAQQPLSIKSLRIRSRTENKEDLLDVTFTVSSFEPTG
jgi:general secretion pathway protein M